LSSKKNCVIPPSYRTDVLNDQDIAEEIIKSMHVNDYLPEPVPYSNYVPNKYNE
jgi:phenylalanyl-tRNA synthetase beta subunit